MSKLKLKLKLKLKSGKLFVISGPSGAGKGSLWKIAVKGLEMKYSVSCTTRQPRAGELNGREYNFMSREDFQKNINAGEFLEYANVHGEFYGTLKSEVLNILNSGHNVLLEIDVQGALNVKSQIPEAILIFIAPPSIEELRKRLIGRNTEKPEIIELRLKNALHEMDLKNKYDFVIINDDINIAAEKLRKIFEGEY